jgi:predicted SprT family Zn-dependent metalloprotease
MNTDDAYRLATRLMTELLPAGHGWRFKFDTASVRFGCCDYGQKLITLSRQLTAMNEQPEVEETIRHEIAHALAGPTAGHGPKWVAIALSIGSTGTRLYSTAKVRQPPRRYQAYCPHCSKKFQRDRLLKGRYFFCPCTSGRTSADLLRWVDTHSKPAPVAPMASVARTAAPGYSDAVPQTPHTEMEHDMTAKLTASGKALLTQIGNGQFSFFDNGITAGSGIWHENLTDEAHAAVAKTPKGVANVARKLADDGYLTISDVDEDNPWVELTELGASTALAFSSAAVLPAPEVEAPAEPVFDAKAAREALEAKAAEEIAAAKEEAPAKKAVARPKKSVTGDKAPQAKLPTSGKGKAAPAPKEKAAPVDPHTVPDGVKLASIPADSELKWRNKARETKTVVGIYDGAASVTEESPLRWVLHCEAHDAVNRYRTYKEAWLESAHPMAFCPSCSVLYRPRPAPVRGRGHPQLDRLFREAPS